MRGVSYTEEQRERIFQLWVGLGNVQRVCDWCAENEGELGFPPPHPNTIKKWKREDHWEARKGNIKMKKEEVADTTIAGELAEVEVDIRGLVMEGIGVFKSQLKALREKTKGGESPVDAEMLEAVGLKMGVREFKELCSMMEGLIPTEKQEVTFRWATKKEMADKKAEEEQGDDEDEN